jgi:hypothetical protein
VVQAGAVAARVWVWHPAPLESMRACATSAARRRALGLPVTGVVVLAIAVGLIAAESANAPVRPSVIDGAGIGAARRLPSLGREARAGQPIGRQARAGPPIGHLRCEAPQPPAAAIHIELFARGHVVIVPAGIGVAPPRRRSGAYVTGGRCRYPLWTSEPTGLVHLSRPGLKLGDLFAIWGQPLSRERLARWRGAVRAYVGGLRWRCDPAAIPLKHHTQIVVQAGKPVLRPHADYRFPAGQ